MLETPPLSNATLDLAFELTAVRVLEEDYEPLHRDTFEHVVSSRGNQPRTCIFPSTTPDGIQTSTILITPSDVGDQAIRYVHACKHLSAFVRFAHEQQQDFFWYNVAEQLTYRMNESIPTWVSTEGRGVHWLHLRLAFSPKHFQTESYKYYLDEYFWKEKKASTGQKQVDKCRYGRDCRNGSSCRFIHDASDFNL